ncbi:MAG: hypothetical protein WEG36_10550 [Gemmatimonadota bacterium]
MTDSPSCETKEAVTGICVIVGAAFNWRNSRVGFWLNASVLGAVEVGVVAFMLAPGYMRWSDGGIGLGLFVLALVFSTIGFWKGPRPMRVPLVGAR